MNFKRILFLLSLSILVLACEDDSRVFIEGDVVGTVRLVDEFGKEPTDKSGVNVSCGDPATTAISDEKGWFKLQSVPAGTYNLFYEKEGYGTLKTFNFQHIGGEVPTLATEQIIYELPDVELEVKDITHSENCIYVNLAISPRANFKLRAFASDTSDVSRYNYKFEGAQSATSPVSDCTIEIWTSQSFLKQDKIYMVICAVNPAQDFLSYYDYDTSTNVFYGYSQATEVFTIELGE